ncbi:MAG: hypothetical protein LBP63_10400 [Prevotellaceae bacterium]|jgi:hypothetical protein|nr:hypothetical protein [Prevotellaceae bacterium]
MKREKIIANPIEEDASMKEIEKKRILKENLKRLREIAEELTEIYKRLIADKDNYLKLNIF